MSRPRVFWIKFDNPRMVFYNGQKLSGTVCIENDEELEIDGVYVRIQGEGSVSFGEYSTDEEYFDRRVYVYGNGSDIKLPVGHHNFPFAVILPTEIPSSYEGDYGNVRYSIEATIKTGLFKFDFDHKVPFWVNSIFDLNKIPGLGVPVTRSDYKYNCCCCCRSGPINLKVTISKGGFIPGENIFISADIENKSSSVIPAVKAKLIQNVKFRAEGHSRMSNNTVSERRSGEILPGQTFHWNELPLPVPRIPPTNLEFCQHIDIDYIVFFEVKSAGLFSFDLEVEIPVLIGNVALDPNPFNKPPQAYFSAQPVYQLVPSIQGLSENTMILSQYQSSEANHLTWQKVI